MLRAVAGCRRPWSALVVAGAAQPGRHRHRRRAAPAGPRRVGPRRRGVRPGHRVPRLRRARRPAPRARWSGRRSPRGLAALAAALLVVAVSPVPWVALVPLALGGATAVVVESLLTGRLQDAMPDHYRAGALGVADSVMVGACLVGSLVTPALVEAVGPRPTVLVGGAAALVARLVCLASGVRASSRRPAPRSARSCPRRSRSSACPRSAPRRCRARPADGRPSGPSASPS